MTQDTQMVAMIAEMKGELGELRGQLREMTNIVSRMSEKLDAATAIIQKNSDHPDDIADLKARVAALEAEKHQRDGAISLGSWFMSTSIPGWLAAGALFIYTYFFKK